MQTTLLNVDSGAPALPRPLSPLPLEKEKEMLWIPAHCVVEAIQPERTKEQDDVIGNWRPKSKLEGWTPVSRQTA